MPVSGVTAATSGTVVAKDKTGFSALSSEDFLKLLVTQLQNQDPTQPVGNDELLGQLSQMRSLQSNIELGDALKAISSNQNLSTAASFIGKTATGSDAQGQEVSGNVESAFVANGAAYVRINGTPVELSKVNAVEQAA